MNLTLSIIVVTLSSVSKTYIYITVQGKTSFKIAIVNVNVESVEPSS